MQALPQIDPEIAKQVYAQANPEAMAMLNQGINRQAI